MAWCSTGTESGGGLSDMWVSDIKYFAANLHSNHKCWCTIDTKLSGTWLEPQIQIRKKTKERPVWLHIFLESLRKRQAEALERLFNQIFYSGPSLMDIQGLSLSKSIGLPLVIPLEKGRRPDPIMVDKSMSGLALWLEREGSWLLIVWNLGWFTCLIRSFIVQEWWKREWRQL